MKLTLENLISLIQVQLGKHAVHAQDRFIEDLGTESVDLLNIVALAEDTFGVALEETEIAGIRSVQDFYTLIVSRL